MLVLRRDDAWREHFQNSLVVQDSRLVWQLRRKMKV